MVVRVLDNILVHNLLQTMHKITMTDDRVHLVASLIEGKSIDIPAIMCQVMLQSSIDSGMKQGLPFGVLVIQILQQCGISFPKDAVVLPQRLPIDDGRAKVDNAKGSSGSWRDSTAYPNTCTSSSRSPPALKIPPLAPKTAPSPPLTQPPISGVSLVLSAVI